jgi:tetratricopeptide (TPR) repeat protein
MSRRRWSDVALVVIALIVRLTVAWRIDAIPLSRHPQYDSFEYLAWARHIAAGDFQWPVPPAHGPGYPFFLGALLAIGGGSLFFVRIVQALTGAFTCLFIARAGERMFDEESGRWAGFALAVYAPLIWIDASILAETLLLTLIAASLWCAAARRAIPAALLLGLATIVRPTAFLFLPLIAVMTAEVWRRRLIVAAICVATIAPVTIVNYRTTHTFIPIQAFGGINVYLGNSPLRDGLASARPGGDWERLEPEPLRNGIVDARLQDRWFIDKTRAEIAAEPGAFVKLLLRKFVWTFQNSEIRDTQAFGYFAESSWLLRVLPRFMLLFALAATGAFAALRRPPHPALRATLSPVPGARGVRVGFAFVAIAALSCVALVVGARYRLPLVLGLALFAGVAISRAIDLAKSRSWRPLATMIVIALIAGSLTRIWRHAPSENFAEERTLNGEALLKDGDVAAAEREYRTAISLDPNNARAWDSLGALLAQRGDRLNARSAFTRAASLNDSYARPQRHLAALSEELHDVDGATAAYRRAIQLEPRDPQSYERLGALLTREGRVAEALATLERAYPLDPDNRELMLMLARLYGAAGGPHPGAQLAGDALSRFGGKADDWLLLATLAAHDGDFPTAERAVDEARAQSGWNDATLFTAALIRFREQRYDDAKTLIARVNPAWPGAAQLRDEIVRKSGP